MGTKSSNVAQKSWPAIRNLAVDPGVHGCGYAFTDSTNELFGAGYVEDPDEICFVYGQRVVIEVPQIYQLRHQKGDQNDLINVALVAGRVWQLALEKKCLVNLVRPLDWKGQINKGVTVARVEEVLGDYERTRIKWPAKHLRHNVYDAIHLAMRTFTKRKV